MAEIRPAASLTSSLLARRGDARPAMRRQAITHLHVPLAPDDDLGWNDTGEDEGEESLSTKSFVGLTPPDRVASYQPGYDDEQDDYEADEDQPHGGMSPLSPITRHLEAIAQRITEVARDTSSKSMAIRLPSPGKPKMRRDYRKAAFTLRLDEERHLRLRLLSALTRRSSQQLLIEALDAFLARHEKVEDLAGQVESGGVDYDEAAGL